MKPRVLFLALLLVALPLAIVLLLPGVAAKAALESEQPVIQANREPANPQAPAVNVSGVITQNTTWDKAHSPYVLTGDVTVSAGVTLTVEPGVKVAGNDGRKLTVLGHLYAAGSITQPITFTSSLDSGPNQWAGLLFDGGTGYLKHVTVRYGGDTNGVVLANVTARNVLAGELRIESSVIRRGRDQYGTAMDYGLYIVNSRVAVSDTQFIQNGSSADATYVDYTLYATGASTALTVTGSTFQGNVGYPVYVPAANVHQVTGNTFSGNSYDRILIAAGTVAPDTRWTVQTGLSAYEFVNDVIVPSGGTLTLEPGVQVMGRGGELRVLGRLEALGEPDAQIIFTSAKGVAANWKGLVFNGGSGYLRHVLVRYAGATNSLNVNGNVHVENSLGSGLHIESSEIREVKSQYGQHTDYGLYIENSRAVVSGTLFTQNGNDGAADYTLYATGASTALTVTGSTFQGNAGYPVYVPAANVHQMTGNTFSGNSYERILMAGGTVAPDTTWTAQAGLSGYEFVNEVIVPSGGTLTIEPGLQVISRGWELRVLGRLEALGEPDGQILFTSNRTTPFTWRGLVFNGGSGYLRHALVRYAGIANSLNVKSNISVKNSPGSGLRIENSEIREVKDQYGNGRDYGIYIDNSRVAISATLLTQNGNSSNVDTIDSAIYALGSSTALTITNSTIQSNAGRGMTLDKGAIYIECSIISSNGGNGIYVASGSSITSLKIIASQLYSNGAWDVNNASTQRTVDARYNWWGGGLGSITGQVTAPPRLPAPSCTFGDLAVAKQDDPDPVLAGTPLTYTLVVSSVAFYGIAEIPDVVLTDTLPASMAFDVITTTQGTCTQDGLQLNCALGALQVDSPVTVTMAVDALSAGSFFNTAGVTTTLLDPYTLNNTAKIDTSVIFTTTDPYIVALSPDRLMHGSRRTLTIYGANFDYGAVVTLDRGGRGEPDPGVVTGTVTFLITNTIQVDLDITSYDFFGEWDVIVHNLDGKTASRPVLILPSLSFLASQPEGSLGFPVGRYRTNYLRLLNIGNDEGILLMQLYPPAPGAIQLIIGPPAHPIEVITQTTQTTITLMLSLDAFQSTSLQMTWIVPPENVIWGTGLAAQSPREGSQVEFNSKHGVAWSGIKGFTKDQAKGMVKGILLQTACQSLGTKLAGLEPDVLDNALNNTLDALGEASTPKFWLQQVGAAIGEKFIPGYGQVDFAMEVTTCTGEIINGMIQTFEISAKRAADRLRARTGDRERAFDEAFNQVTARSSSLYAYRAVLLVDNQLSRPPCNPGVRTPGGYEASVRSAWDPNDKTTNTALPCRLGEAAAEGEPPACAAYFTQSGDPLVYTIQFENKKEATEAAENIVITDVLDPNLDLASLQIVGVSHPQFFTYAISGTLVTFRFTGINLLPNLNPPEGEGYITYLINPKPGLLPGTTIRNKADIVFDFNPAITTPEVIHIFLAKILLPFITRSP